MTTEPQLRRHPDAPEVIVAPSIPAAAGHAVAIPVEIRHRGPRAAQVRITVFGLDARWIPEPLDLGVLQPGEHASIQVTVIPERGAMGAHYPFTIAAEATAAGARPVVGVAESVLALGAAERISMTITPPLPAGVFSRGIRVDITNPGDETRDLTLLPDSASGISVRLRDRKVSVPGRRTVSVKGRVRVRKPTITGGHNTHTFTVAAQGTGAPEQAEATMRSKPLVGGGLRRAIALGLVIALWIGLAIVFIPKISDRFKQKNDVASVTQTSGDDAGSGADGTGSGSGAGGSDGSGGAGAGGAGSDGSGGAGAGGAGGSGEGAGAAAGGYQLSGTVTGPAADGSFVTLAPVALAGIDDGSLPETQSTDQSPRAFRSSASDAIGKSAGPLAAAPRDGFRTTTITTGEKGEFTFSGVTAPGYYLLTIAKEGFTSQRFLINSEALAAPQPLKVELVPGDGSLSGRVIGPDGSAIGAATVVVTDGTVTLQTSSVSASTQTGAPGTWSLDQVSTPGTYLVTASSPGLGSASTLVTLDASGKGTADLTLTAGLSSISGTVSGEDGLGQVGGLGGITVTATGGDVTRTATTVTAAAMRGAFVLPNLPAPGTYTLTFSGQGYLTQTREVTLGASAVTVNTTVSRADAVLSGMISGRDENGKAEGGLGGVGLTLASNDLTMKTMTTSGDGAGSFQFVGVPPGTYVLTATQFGRTSASTTVELAAADAQKVNLLLVADLGAELPANAHIRGQVTDSRTGGPLTCDRSVTAVAAADCVATVTVSAPKDPTQPKAGTVSYTSKATAALNFVYTIPSLDDPDNAGLPPGLYTVRISAPGYEDAITHVQVAQGQTAPAPPASMPALGIISGTVTTRVDKPAKASCVLAIPVGVTVPKNLPTSCAVAAGGNTCTASGISGAQPCALASQGGANEPPLGTYQIRGLKHGQYQMVLISQDPEYVYTVGTVPIVTLELGADGQFNAVLDRLGRINVSVVKVDPATGSPVPVKGASVSATKQTGDGVASTGPVTSNDNGIAILTGLDGTYKVSGSFTESGETITADATADPTGLNQTANVTLVIAKQSGPLVGRVVVDSGDGTAPVGGVTVTVSGTVGYQGSNAATGSAQVTTTTSGCYAIVPAGWNGDIATLKGPNCAFTANDQAAVGTLKNLLTGQPATLISDRIDVSVAALPKGTAGDTWTETYPATGQAIAECPTNACGDKGRMVPDITVKASAMTVGSLALMIAGPTGFGPPAMSGLHFTVLSKPSNSGGVNFTPGSWSSGTNGTVDGVPSTTFTTDLTFADSQYGAATGKALPGRYKLQVSLTDFVTQNIDLVCPFMAAACYLTSADGTSPDPALLLRLPTVSVQINLPDGGPAVTDWTQASVSQTSGPTLSQVTVFKDGGPQTSKLQFGGSDSLVVAANTSYAFAVTVPGYGVNPISVTCGANYLAEDCSYSSELAPLQDFPDINVALSPSIDPGTGDSIPTGNTVTALVTSPSNLTTTIQLSVAGNGKVSWTDPRGGVNPGQVMPGDYEITFRRAGFVDTAVTLSCTDASCLFSGAAYDDSDDSITMDMLPQPELTVTVTLPSGPAYTAGSNFDLSHSTLTAYRNGVKVSTANLNLLQGKIDSGATTASAKVDWRDSAQAFDGITGLGTYSVNVSIDGFESGTITNIVCTTVDSPCTGSVTLGSNPTQDASALRVVKLPRTGTPVQLIVTGPAGTPTVSLTDDGSGALTWQQGNALPNVIKPLQAGQSYKITATLAGYESAEIVSGTGAAKNVFSFTCTDADHCAFPQIVMTKAATLSLIVKGTDGSTAEAVTATLSRDAMADVPLQMTAGSVPVSGRSTTNVTTVQNEAEEDVWADGSYTLKDVHAAGYAFADSLDVSSTSATAPYVTCTYQDSTNATQTLKGLYLVPGGTTTCTVTLQKLGAITGTTWWQHNFRDSNGDPATVEQRGGVELTAKLIKVPAGSDIPDPAPTFQMISATTASGSVQVGDFQITGSTDTEGLIPGTWKITATDGEFPTGFEPFVGVVDIGSDYSLSKTATSNVPENAEALEVAGGAVEIVLVPKTVALDVLFSKADGTSIPVPNIDLLKLTDEASTPEDWTCKVSGGSTTGTDNECTKPDGTEKDKIHFDNLSPGTYHLSITFTGGQYNAITNSTVLIKPSGVAQEIKVIVDAQAGTISGALVDSANHAITTLTAGAATISLYKWGCDDIQDDNCKANTFGGTHAVVSNTATGTFEFTNLPSGDYWIHVEAPGYAPKSDTGTYIKVTIGSPTPPPTIQLLPAKATSVTIAIEDGNGHRLEDGTATLVALTSPHQPANPVTPIDGTIGSDGTVSFNQLPTGTYSVAVTGQTGALYTSRTTADLDISDKADGAVVDLSSTPLALNQASVALTVGFGSGGCSAPPADSTNTTIPISITNAATVSPITWIVLTPPKVTSGSATTSVLLPPGSYSWKVTPPTTDWLAPTTLPEFSVPSEAAVPDPAPSVTLTPASSPNFTPVVTVSDEGVEGAIVTATPRDSGTPVTGETDSDGKTSLCLPAAADDEDTWDVSATYTATDGSQWSVANKSVTVDEDGSVTAANLELELVQELVSVSLHFQIAGEDEEEFDPVQPTDAKLKYNSEDDIDITVDISGDATVSGLVPGRTYTITGTYPDDTDTYTVPEGTTVKAPSTGTGTTVNVTLSKVVDDATGGDSSTGESGDGEGGT